MSIKEINETYEELDKYSTFIPRYKPKTHSLYNQLRTLTINKEYNILGVELCKNILDYNENHYSAFIYLKLCINEKIILWEDELEYCTKLIKKSIKCFQNWDYRLFIYEFAIINKYIKDEKSLIDKELNFLEEIFYLDQKNYHKWIFRTKFCKLFNQFELEKVKCLEYLKIDIKNNSVWSYLNFLNNNNSTEINDFNNNNLLDQLDFCLKQLSIEPKNECVYNYISGCANKTLLVNDKEYREKFINSKYYSKIMTFISENCFENKYFWYFKYLYKQLNPKNDIKSDYEALITNNPQKLNFYSWIYTKFNN